MGDLRVGIACHENEILQWQAEIGEAVASLKGVRLAAWLERPSKGARYKIPSRADAAATTTSTYNVGKVAPHSRWPELDVVLNLTRELLGARACQVWRLRFEDEVAPGRAEHARRLPTTTVTLVEENGAGRVIGRVRFKTAPSARRNADAAFRETKTTIVRALSAMSSSQSALESLAKQPWDNSIVPPRSPATRLKERWAKHTTRSAWTIGIARGAPLSMLQSGKLPEINWLRPLPEGRFFADPFIVDAHGDDLIFMAEDGVDTPPFHGRISEIRANSHGRVTSVKPAIELPTHLSFPFSFEHAGVRYCLPENHESNGLHLFAQTTDAWTQVATVIDGLPVVDPVLFRDNGVWRLFCCLRSHDDIVHLFLFSAHDLRGPWRAHPLNPIKSDVRGARPAGALFSVNDSIYRPAQDCSARYGGALVIQRVLRMTDIAYDEEEALRIFPESLGPGYVGVHTLNFHKDHLVIDALKRVRPNRRRREVPR